MIILIKRFLSVCLVVSLLSVPAFAMSNEVYELELDVVEVPTMLSLAVDNVVMPLAATSWDTSDQSNLSAIRNAFYNPNTGYVSNSLLGWVKKLADNYQPSPFDSDSVSELSNIATNIVRYLPYLSNVNTYIPNLEMIGDILNDTSTLETSSRSILSLLQAKSPEITYIFDGVASLVKAYSFDVNTPSNFGSSGFSSTIGPANLPYWVNQMGVQLGYDVELSHTKDRSLYSRIKQLQEVLASDDDRVLANSQKANREEIEDSFLSGSSGDTSLGASDFGALSDIGGSFKDTVSLNGQSSVSDFTDGLAAADLSGQGWFSTATKDALDTVSSSVSYSLRGDPYNMAGWEARYAWLNGG